MRFHHAAITCLARALPEERLSSAEIERQLQPLYHRLKLPEGRLELMTGIQERRMWPQGTRPSSASAAAVRALLEKVAVDVSTVDVLMHTAVSRDRLEPATAAYVHRDAGLSARTQIFDLSNACLGFLNGLVVASALIEGGQAARVIVCAGENGRPLVEKTLRTLLKGEFDRRSIKPYFANLTIGCGAVAALVTRRDDPLANRCYSVEHATVGTDTRHVELCEGDSSGDGLDMQTDAEALLEAGLGLAAETYRLFLRETAREQFDLTITHQVGATHQRRLREALGLAVERDFVSYPGLGNVGSVACPVTLSLAEDAGRVEPGMHIGLLGIGSGLSSVMLHLRRCGG